MEQARIKTNTKRAAAALQKIHAKDGRSIQEKITYKMFVKERWVDKDKTELDIIIKSSLVKRSLTNYDFLKQLQIDFNKYNIPQNEYKVDIK